MRGLRALLVVVMAAYVVVAALLPERIYIERFLQTVSFAEWALLQPAPAMYAAETHVRSASTGRVFSEPHHPLRIFYEGRDEVAQCGDYTISIRYRSIVRQETYRSCNGRLDRVTRR